MSTRRSCQHPLRQTEPSFRHPQAGRELTLRPASSWRERYALAEGERELVLIDGKSWGRRPVKVTLADPTAIEPGLLLFAAFIVRQLAVSADSTSSAATTAAMTGSYSG